MKVGLITKISFSICFWNTTMFSIEILANNRSNIYLLQDTVQLSVIQNNDSIITKPKTVVMTKNTPGIKFNPRDYMLQKRYLELGDTFSTKRFYEHLYFGFVSGFQQLSPKGIYRLTPAVPLGFVVGNEFTRLHALRLTATYMTYSIKDNDKTIEQFGMDIDYLFNLSSYLYGYSKNRRFNLSGTIGLGYINSSFQNYSNNVLKVQVGAQLSLRLSRNIKVIAEPYWGIASDQIDHSEAVNSSKYDVFYGLKAGMALTLQSSDATSSKGDFNNNLFFDFSQGLRALSESKLPFLKTLGTGYQVSVGKWFDPLIGLRLTGSVSDYYWAKTEKRATLARPEYENNFKAALFTGRVEALINLRNFTQTAQQKKRMIDLNLSLGGEYGWMMKFLTQKSKNGLKCTYAGFTGGLQVLYNVTPYASLFVEPRILMATYEIPYINTNKKESFTDRVYSVNAGVRVTCPTTRERMQLSTHIFEPHWFVGGQLGGSKQLVSVKQVGDNGFNVLGGIHAGYHLAPLVSAKLQLEYMMINKQLQTPYIVDVQGVSKRYTSLWKHRYGILNTKLAYMFNFTNFSLKHDPHRRLNLYAEGGTIYSVFVTQGSNLYSKELKVGNNPKPIINNKIGRGAWAVFGGMVADYRINAHWSVYAEPEIQYYFSDFIGGGATIRLHDLIMKFSLGVGYRF